MAKRKAIKIKPIYPPSSLSKACFDRVSAIVDGVDEVSRQMEAKWGMGRLRLLVSDDLREKFDRQLGKFNRAVWHEELPEIEVQAEGFKKGWRVLDEAATSGGHKPIEADVWETTLSDGTVIAIVPTTWDGHAAWQNERYLQVYTLAEIARLVEGYPSVAKAKQVFPGATVVRTGPTSLPLNDRLNDDIPI